MLLGYANKYVFNGNESAKLKDASETNRVIENTENHKINPIIVTLGINAVNTPIVVATPFPPLNFKNIENTCPEIKESDKINAIE